MIHYVIIEVHYVIRNNVLLLDVSWAKRYSIKLLMNDYACIRAYQAELRLLTDWG